MAGVNNNQDKKEPLPEIPLPLLNDPRPAPDTDQVVSAFKVRLFRLIRRVALTTEYMETGRERSFFFQDHHWVDCRTNSLRCLTEEDEGLHIRQ
jgi:hypothetical protein